MMRIPNLLITAIKEKLTENKQIMIAIIKTYYPDNELQKRLDGMGFAELKMLFGHSEVLEAVKTLLENDLNVAVLQNGTSVSTADTLIWVVKKGERFVQR